jgi:uncharacterized protein
MFLGTRKQMIEYEEIWKEVTDGFNSRKLSSIHGPNHWHNVEDVGLKIAHMLESFGRHVDRDVVRLFAVLHDSCRMNDNHDPDHGRRAAEYAKQIRGRLFDLDDSRFELLYKAIAWHADGFTAKELTIGACFDADRMDLRRVGIKPDPALISTPEMRVRV